MKLNSALLVLPLMATLASTSTVHALTDKEWRELTTGVASLRGVSAVCVFVDLQDNYGKAAGLSVSDMQTKVELRLRSLGISVVNEKDAQGIGVDTGRLEVHVLAQGMPSPSAEPGSPPLLYAFMIQVGLRQMALTVREPRQGCIPLTWEQSTVYMCGKERTSAVYDRVLEFIDGFANDYLTANPKHEPTTG